MIKRRVVLEVGCPSLAPHESKSRRSATICRSVNGQAEGGRVGPQSWPMSCKAAFTAVTLVPFCSSAQDLLEDVHHVDELIGAEVISGLKGRVDGH